MMKWTHSPRFLGALALFVGLGLASVQLNAQQDTSQAPDQASPSQQAPNQQTPTQQAPNDPNAQQPSQPSQPPAQSAPDAQSQSSASGQVFAGTIVKTGDKYVLQSSTGTAYEVDRQDLLAKYEGKQVRINGTLDPDGKTIHVK
jgi:hypothetical protein